jgi:hypothetical protein
LHLPELQRQPARHALSQAPQCSRSVCRSTQASAQRLASFAQPVAAPALPALAPFPDAPAVPPPAALPPAVPGDPAALPPAVPGDPAALPALAPLAMPALPASSVAAPPRPAAPPELDSEPVLLEQEQVPSAAPSTSHRVPMTGFMKIR